MSIRKVLRSEVEQG